MTLMRFLPLVLVCALVPLRATGSALAPGTLAELARRVGFQVGAAVDHDPDALEQELTAREFTSVTPENALKWAELSPAPGVYDFSRGDAVVDRAEAAGQRVRGHTLFWDRINGKPSWLEPEVAAAPDPPNRLWELMEEHVQTVVGRYAGRVAQWDVVNEPLALVGAHLDSGNFFFEMLGEEYIDIAFHVAHAVDPAAKLYLNETLAESFGFKFNGLIALVERLLERGVPIHGVGLQGHFFVAPPDPVALRTQLERIAALGLEIELTEVDIPIAHFAATPDPLAAQGRAYRDVFEACLAVPACTGITTWGVDDRETWLDHFFLSAANAPNRPLLFDQLGRPKPAYEAAVAALAERIQPVAIDIRPGSAANAIRPPSRGVVPVAVLGSAELDVREIDPSTLGFGPAGAALAHRSALHREDVNADAFLDLVGHFRAEESGVAAGDAEACLTGRTYAGTPFEGCDAIRTVGRAAPAAAFGGHASR